MDIDIDNLIDLAVADSLAESGVSSNWLMANNLRVQRILPAGLKWRPARWTPEEDRFLADNLGKMSLDDIAAALGRTAAAIKVRQVRRQVSAPSKRPGYLTGNTAARALGSDIHAIMRLRNMGVLPIEMIPGKKGIMAIKRIRLAMWCVNPENWIYFKADKIRDAQLKRLVLLAQSRWSDAWWTTAQVGDFHGVAHSLVETHIMRGKIPAKRWGNWWIKRSDAVKARFYVGKGSACRYEWSPRADAFMLRVRAQGLLHEDIARMLGWGIKRVRYRLKMLREMGK